MSLYTGLYTGLSGIRAGQAGVQTVSHNVANASTPGYTRQRMDLVGAPPYASPDGMLGTGVDIAGFNRLRDDFVDARVRTTSADFAERDVRSQLLRRTEAVMGEPDTGISSELTALWNSFDDLAMEPHSAATRQQVLNQLDAVSSRVNSVTEAWDQLATDTTQRLDAAVTEVNDLLTQIADINQRIAKADPAKISNELLDERDLAVDTLAELTGARATRKPDRTVDLTLATAGGPVALVTGSTATPLTATGTQLEVGGADVTAAVGGEVAALHQFVHTTAPAQRQELEDFAAQLAQRLNDQHALGTTDAGTPGGPLLTVGAAGGSPVLQVAITTAADLAPGTTSEALDGTNASALAALRDSSLVDDFDSVVVRLGSRVAGAARAARAAGDVAVAAQTERQSQHSVSIDEEMVDMVRYQRQLEAASRVMTAIDQALDTLVNRVGIVGR